MICTPKYEWNVVSCNVELLNVYLDCLSGLACDRSNEKHLEILHFICHKSCHLDRVLRSDCSFWKSGAP